MSKAHKAALAEGRDDSRAVRRYLEALAANKPKRGRKRSAETVESQLAAVTEELESADALNRLLLTQKLADLQRELDKFGVDSDPAEYEEGFIESAAAYGERKGINYATWRQIGVSPELLRQAGITRSS